VSNPTEDESRLKEKLSRCASGLSIIVPAAAGRAVVLNTDSQRVTDTPITSIVTTVISIKNLGDSR